MTDNEIIKALECHSNDYTFCMECPFANRGECSCELSSDALDLINRQKAEIERLTAAHPKTIESIKKIYTTAKAAAVRELIEKLTEEYKDYALADSISIDRIFLSIKHIAKEMVGEMDV